MGDKLNNSLALPSFRSRVAGFLRNTRVRAIVLIVGGYNIYHAGKNYNIMYKPFSGHRHRPGETVLDLNLDAVTVERNDSMRPLSTSEEIRLERLIATLNTAKADPRVAGLVVRGLSGLRSMGLAELTELRNAISDFSTGWGGKHTMLHIPDGIGAGGNGTVPLFFASVFDSIHIPPSSPVIIPGISMATLFFKKLLDNIGLQAKKVARKDFKTMANPLTEEKFTDAHRESTVSLLEAIMTDIVSNISSARGLSEETVRAAIDMGIISPKEAHEIGLVDQPMHRDELPEELRKRLSAAAQLRADARTEAVTEWRAAMRELCNAWDADGGTLDLWEDGTVSQNLANFNFVVPMSVTLTDTRQDITRETTEAEIRALKAHKRWLDTCPWEEFNVSEENSSDDDNIYRSVPYISSLLNLERRLCEQGIRTLEQFPLIVNSHRKEGDGGDVLALDMAGSYEVVRWVRSVWKAKCFAARMFGTVRDVTELSKHRKVEDGKDEADEESSITELLEPRPFLVGYTDGLRFQRSDRRSNGADESEGSNRTVDKSSDSEEQAIQAGVDKSDPLKLQYVRFSDYADLVSSEYRAYAERGSPLIRMETRNPYPFLYGMVDNQDREALIRLQSPGHRLTPWRLNVPKGNAVAVIRIEGVINDDDADTTRAAIRRADKDPNVKAIVLRIDSPGGSAIASDIIARAVEVAKKPVVASMGNLCASGGYYIAAPCNLILSSPMTITGSIGVIFQYFNASELFDKIGITGDTVDSGKFAKYFGALAPVTEWSEDFGKRIDDMIDGSYADFLQVVSKGRGMDNEQTEAVAQGRVWAGSDALRLRLVDRTGGLRDAIDAASELANLAPDADVRAVDYPTLGMQVQDAARRRGILPANLDEEGDEVVPEKRRRRWLWSRNEKDNPGGYDGSDPLKTPANASLPMEDWNIGQYLLSKMLLSLDSSLLAASTSSFSSSLFQAILGKAFKFLNGRAHDVVASELEAVRATNGRPAALAANVRVND